MHICFDESIYYFKTTNIRRLLFYRYQRFFLIFDYHLWLSSPFVIIAHCYYHALSSIDIWLLITGFAHITKAIVREKSLPFTRASHNTTIYREHVLLIFEENLASSFLEYFIQKFTFDFTTFPYLFICFSIYFDKSNIVHANNESKYELKDSCMNTNKFMN